MKKKVTIHKIVKKKKKRGESRQNQEETILQKTKNGYRTMSSHC
jgi:hypothetical protein